MLIRLSEPLVEAIGWQRLTPLGVRKEDLTWKKFVEVRLAHMSLTDVRRLLALVEPHKGSLGTRPVIRDLKTWLTAHDKKEGFGAAKPRKLLHFADLLTEFMLGQPGHRIYQRLPGREDVWLASYVNEVEHHEEIKERDYVRAPENVSMELVFDKLGKQESETFHFYDGDIHHKTVLEILVEKGFYPETPEMRATYLSEVERYRDLVPRIGFQLVADHGSAEAHTEQEKNSYRYWFYGHETFHFGPETGRNRMLVDILNEKETGEAPEEDDDSDRRNQVNTWFWERHGVEWRKRMNEAGLLDDERYETVRDEDGTQTTRKRKGLPDEDLFEEDERPTIEVPVHPFLVVFDLQRHLRLDIHVSFVQPYVYTTDLIDKLVLPKENKDLIQMLVEHRGLGFKDIVEGKSGGAIVLLTGPPGTGKTLTAEVYSEAEQRPLYSVQASQLGTDPDTVEKNLIRVLRRCARWQAILLLDEADVYVHTRGNDLGQNAIVGVFLRVLEYYATVMFLTTNRPDLVDDAIASRCIARIDYSYPSVPEQREIWKVLSDNANIRVPPAAVELFSSAHPLTSGRDVKNLLKLAALIGEAQGKPISRETLEYVRRFKPTTTPKEASA
jgi:ATPase family associated with various cellular activities (AAA)